MYESYFGFSATPFNLNPDPNFYFESRGHGHALSYLKFGVYQGEGFVVVTGEIGAGKTTLVRTLLAGVDPKEIVAAQIVSTQLDAGDLLRSVALAFGIPPKNLSKAELIATIEAFLTELVLQKKRALLVVDEAQNLNLAAIEELRMLSNFQLGNHALLQSFLIGQPELRALLTSKPMEQLRQRVIASCHLGPMDRAETEAYVRHRLARVGWTDRPTFESAAFDQIFEWTGGVPRRVNLLCNRLLLSTFLQSRTDIDAALVRETARDLLSEVGEAPQLEPVPTEPIAPSQPVAADLAPVARVDRADQPLLLLAGGRSDDVKLAALARALRQRKSLPPVQLCRLGDADRFADDDSFVHGFVGEAPPPTVEVDGSTPAARVARAIQLFDAIVDQRQPRAVVVAGTGDAVLGAAIVCFKRGVKLVVTGAGLRRGAAGSDGNAALIEQMADLFYPADAQGQDTLIRVGAQKARVLQAGNLIADGARWCQQTARAPAEILAHADALQPWLAQPRGYGVVSATRAIDAAPSDELAEILSLVRQVSQDIPLIWPIRREGLERLRSLGLRGVVEDPRIAFVDPLSHVDAVALMCGAAMVLTDSPDVQACAAAVRVPFMRIDQEQPAAPASKAGGRGAGGRVALTLPDVKKVGAGAFKVGEPPRELDGHAGDRIAEHLTEWLHTSSMVAQLMRT